MSLKERMKSAVSMELKRAVSDTFSSGTLRDVAAAGVNAGLDSFRRKAASKLAATPEVDQAGRSIGAERAKQFFSDWGLWIAGGVVLLILRPWRWFR